MRTIGISAAEQRRGALGTSALAEAAAAVREEGYVVLADAVPREPIARLRDAFDRELEVLGANGSSRRRLRHAPPAEPSLVDGSIVANPIVAQLSRALLGPRAYNNLYSADVNLPGSEPQRLHVDTGQLWPDLPHAHPAASLMINVPLVDTTDANGSTELWPGTHLDTRFAVWVTPAAEQARRAEWPPLRANVRAGSVIVRDARLWHRGMPNVTDRVRVVVTMMHHIFWLERGAPMEFDRACEPAFRNPDLASHVRYAVEH